MTSGESRLLALRGGVATGGRGGLYLVSQYLTVKVVETLLKLCYLSLVRFTVKRNVESIQSERRESITRNLLRFASIGRRETARRKN